jgi:hypothetical protein
MTVRHVRGPVPVILGLFALPMLLVETRIIGGRPLTPWVVVNLLSYLPITAVSVAWRKLGHAAVARAVGLHNRASEPR